MGCNKIDFTFRRVLEYQIPDHVLIPNESLTLHFSGCWPLAHLTRVHSPRASVGASLSTQLSPRAQSVALLRPNLSHRALVSGSHKARIVNVPSLLPVAWCLEESDESRDFQ